MNKYNAVNPTNNRTERESKLFRVVLTVFLLAGETFTVSALSLTNLAGTWNNVMLSTPSRLTMEMFTLPAPYVGSVLVNIPEKGLFDARTGTIVLQANGVFTGSASGTASLGDGGGVVLGATGEASAAFMLNAAGDFMYAVKYPDPGLAVQDVELLLKAPATISNSEFAGTWNVLSFATPSEIILEKDSYSGVAFVTNAFASSGFRIGSRTLTANANGTLVLNQDGNLIPGTFSFTGAGGVHLVFNAPPPMGTSALDFFINGSKNILAGVFPLDPTAKEIMIALKQPGSAAPADFKGLWRWGSFGTPVQLTQIRVGVPNTTNYSVVTDIVEKNDFEIHSQAVCVGHNGGFTASSGPAAGGATVNGAGLLQVTVTNAAEGVQADTLWFNAARDVMVGIKSDGRNRLTLSTRAPAETVVRESIGFIAAAGGMYWASDINRSLQYSTNLTTGWTTLTNTTGQGAYTYTGRSNLFFRVIGSP